MIGRIKAEEMDCPVTALSKKRKRTVKARELSKRRLRRLKNVFIPDQPGLEPHPQSP